ncbi:uncharacterized protein PFL1_04791 [Pseudozyma flocculosa PF-1]|nr:uncharacterized protein PFL1_04791 [Pseudozyma flocculosa PF-1]EPQ27653.1 hypothetical protein PFL1_04791 [Pseudozyma flocculosa PF-1]
MHTSASPQDDDDDGSSTSLHSDPLPAWPVEHPPPLKRALAKGVAIAHEQELLLFERIRDILDEIDAFGRHDPPPLEDIRWWRLDFDDWAARAGLVHISELERLRIQRAQRMLDAWIDAAESLRRSRKRGRWDASSSSQPPPSPPPSSSHTD